MNSERDNQKRRKRVKDNFDTNVKRERDSKELANSSDEFEHEKQNLIDKSIVSARESDNFTNRLIKHERDTEDFIDRDVSFARKIENLTDRPLKRKRDNCNLYIKTKRNIDHSSVKTKRNMENSSVKTKRNIENSSVKNEINIANSSIKTERDIEKSSVETKRNIENSSGKTERDIENLSVKTERPGESSAKIEETKQDCVETEDVGVKVEVKEDLDIGPVVLQHTDMALMMTRTKLEPDNENDSGAALQQVMDVHLGGPLKTPINNRKRLRCDPTERPETVRAQQMALATPHRPASHNIVTNMNSSYSSDERPLQPRKPLRELNTSIESKKSNRVSKKGNYECDTCSARFKYLQNFKKHLLIHTVTTENYSKVNKNNKIECDKCPSQFGSVHNFRKHHEIYHTSERLITYSCDICLNNYSNKWNLREHIKLKHQLKLQPVSCPHCSKLFNNKTYLRRHINFVHLRKRNKKCHNCNTKFMTQLKLDIHAKICQNIQFYCNLCNKYYSNEQHLTYHIKAFHLSNQRENSVKNDEILCDICGLRLDIHKKKCKNIQLFCEICNKYYCNAQSLNDHVRKYHNEETHRLCDICGKSFSCTSTLNKHMHRFHLKNKDLSKLFQCEQCNKCFSTNKNLLAHMARTSCTPGQTLFKCDKCIKSFVTKRQLLAHKTRSCHTGLAIPCDLCYKKFKSISYISDHKRNTHAHMLPYSCDQCSATFRRKDLLAYHVSKCYGCSITTKVTEGPNN